ncbi:MAG: NUDIX hydrolase [Rhodobacteraceae bacterium]|nr:NUDIX hydrolase [Paracoccaceae bacterium]
MPHPRVAVRGLLLLCDRLLLVNAYRGRTNLWCAPGGGVERGTSLPDNLIREFHEETGLHICVGAPCLINEFHDPNATFHQVDIYFRVFADSSRLPAQWTDPEGIVNRRRFASREEIGSLRVKPDSLAQAA